MTSLPRQLKDHRIFLFSLLLVIGIFSSIFIYLASSDSGPQYSAKNGVLDLSDWDFQKDGNAELKGEWEFYWKRFLISESGGDDIDGLSRERMLFEQPKTWNGYRVGDEVLTGHGWASYRLKVKVQDPEQILAVSIKPMSTAYELWIDGDLAASNGKIGLSKNMMEPGFLKQTVTFKPKGDEIEFILQISNFHHRRGGVWLPIILGAADSVYKAGNRKKAIDWILSTALIVLAIYHIAVFFQRKETTEAFFLAGFCLLMATRVWLIGERILFAALQNFSWEFVHKLEYITLMISLPFLISFIHKLFPKELKFYVVKLCYLYSLVSTLIVTATTSHIYSWTIVPFEVVFIVVGFYSLFAIYRAIVHSRPNAEIMFIGVLILLIVGVNDALHVNQAIFTMELFNFGILSLTLIQTYILSRVFSNALHTSEKLSDELKEKNEILDISNRQKELKRIELEKQLFRSQKLEAIGRLTGGIAHDFNNILGTMLGYIEMLMAKKNESSVEQNYLKEVYKAGERATDLVDQILNFSGTNESELIPLNIKPVIKEVHRLLRATLPANIKLKQKLDDNCSPIMANETQIHQVVVNLVTNAAQAIGEEGGDIHIGLSKVENDGNLPLAPGLETGPYLQLTVEDSGQGMSNDVMERIFDPFFTTKGTGSGFGLGLSVVQGIVQNHSGEIAVSSVPGKGTTFRLFFPAIENAPAQEQIEEQPPLRGKGHVMIVDDEASLLKFYRSAIEGLGYQVTATQKSGEVVDLIKAEPDKYNLIFTDHAMPDITGIQLSREILNIKPDIPIILATGYHTQALVEKANEIGIRMVLKKPLKIRQLSESFHDVMRAPKQG